jgi:hypothetical protein
MTLPTPTPTANPASGSSPANSPSSANSSSPGSSSLAGSSLAGQVRRLLAEALTSYQGAPEEERLRTALTRMDEPLRVAFAGRLKAGKSTLLNALVGERLAATDATECTRIVTWYANGLASRAWAYPHGESPRQLKFSRLNGRSVIDLGSLRPEDVDRLAIEIPSSRLERMTLIDTPGIGSLSTEVSARTTSFLADDGSDSGADAVLYLMRHLHSSDVGFLESFHNGHLVGSTPVTAIGVLSRADEVGAGRSDALDLAGRIAADYRQDARVRALVQTVVPVTGLLAEAGTALTERDHATLSTLAGAPGTLLLSADRFVVDPAPTAVPAERRREILAGMGLFGVRLAVELIRLGLARDAGELATELRRRSGVEELRTVLLTQFAERRDLLKAHHAVRTLEAVLTARPVPDEPRLRRRLEALLADAHEFAELRLLNDLRTGVVDIRDPLIRLEAETLLGVDGTATRPRLGLPLDTPDDELRAALLVALRRWQRLGASPIADAGTRRTAEVLRRTLEGLLTRPPPVT